MSAVASERAPAPDAVAGRWERLRDWLRALTPLSAATLVVGATSIGLVLLGTLILITVYGWTPSTEILATLRSRSETTLLYAAVGLGLVAMALGWGLYKRMRTKASRESSLSGAALGAQGALLAALLLVVRSGDKFDIFIRQYFSFDRVAPFMDQFFNAAKNTLVLALAGQGLGMVLGLIFAMLVLSNRIVVRAPARSYINLFRGTPLLVQLTAGYFGVVLGLGLDVSVFTTAAVILGLNAGAYTAEIFRSGIQSLEKGQMEAARSLGMSYLQAMGYIVVPQAVRRVIPPLTNEFVILIKDTSLVAFLGLTFLERELLAWGRDTFAELFNSTPFLVAAVGYLIVTLPLIRLVTTLERRLRSGLVGIGG